jgi:hypothetical protein
VRLRGDLVRLVELWGLFTIAEAVAWIGHRYGIELPERPESWYRKQDRQARTRELMREERRNIHRRRIFRIFLPMLESIEDEKEREEETNKVWDTIKRWPLVD